MKFLKYLLGIAAIGTAGGLLAAKMVRDKKRQAELDDFLMPEEDETVVIDVPRKNSESEFMMHQDIMSWLKENAEITPITLVFTFVDFKDAYKFQEDAAKFGLSSSVNDEEREVEVIYNGDISYETLKLLSDDLSKLLKDNKVFYQGCRYFAK